MTRWRDPWWRSAYVLALLVAVGFVMLGFAAHGASNAHYAPLQSPWVISGGLAGLALIGFAAGAWSIHLLRRDDAKDREAWEDFTQQAAGLVEGLRTGEISLPKRKSRARPSGRPRASRNPRPSGR